MKDKILYPFQVIIRNKELIWRLSKNDIFDRYKGQPLGAFWAFFHPFVMIAIYIFLFGIVYKTKVAVEETSTLGHASYLLSGIVPWLCIQTAMSQGVVSVLTNKSLVKQVIFPLEVLPIKMVGSAFIIELIYIVMILLYNCIYSKSILWTYILLPYAILIQLIFLIGLNFLISSLSVYLKDMKDIVQVICMVGIYVTPIMYTPAAIPTIFRPLLYINFFSYFIWTFQDCLYYGAVLHPWAWGVSTAISIVFLYLGTSVFQKLKVGFASVI